LKFARRTLGDTPCRRFRAHARKDVNLHRDTDKWSIGSSILAGRRRERAGIRASRGAIDRFNFASETETVPAMARRSNAGTRTRIDCGRTRRHASIDPRARPDGRLHARGKPRSLRRRVDVTGTLARTCAHVCVRSSYAKTLLRSISSEPRESSFASDKCARTSVLANRPGAFEMSAGEINRFVGLWQSRPGAK